MFAQLVNGSISVWICLQWIPKNMNVYFSLSLCIELHMYIMQE